MLEPNRELWPFFNTILVATKQKKTHLFIQVEFAFSQLSKLARRKKTLGSTAFLNKIHILHHWLSILREI
jgi:hypothetical protein